MCFSANASFSASGILLATGIFSMSEAKKSSQIMFAAIPIIFSLQQLTEGMIWTALSHTEYAGYNLLLSQIFLVFALVIWPTWVPLALTFLEKEEKQKKVLKTLSAVGIMFSLTMLYFILTRQSEAVLAGGHIHYDYDFPFANSTTGNVTENILENFTGLIYIAVTVIPHFLSSLRKVQVLGVFILFSYFITKIFYTNYVFSTWCFFAAMISISILFIVRSLNSTKDVHHEFHQQSPSL